MPEEGARVDAAGLAQEGTDSTRYVKEQKLHSWNATTQVENILEGRIHAVHNAGQ